MKQDKITLSHGSGGGDMHELIRTLLLEKFDNPMLRPLADSACVAGRRRLAYTADSFVVKPLVFPGGDIGKLAVCGAVNDLAVIGARPLYLSVAFILEEGLELSVFSAIVHSIAVTARAAGVAVVTGDLKVVERGACDRMFISVSGIGEVVSPRPLDPRRISPGDRVICTGDVGRHGFAVLCARQNFDFGRGILSDCAPLAGMLMSLAPFAGVRCMRDATRGGIATTLNEFARDCGRGIVLREEAVPVSSRVRAAAELLGIDPLYSANEGCALLVVRQAAVKWVLARLNRHALGKRAREIGLVVSGHKPVTLLTTLGTERILPMRNLEQLPRIC